MRSNQKTESTLKAALCQQVKQQLMYSVPIRHEDLVKTRAGVPDISITWGRTTFWIEAKYATPKIITKHKIQLFTMRELAHVSHAFYVIWGVKDGAERTFIVPPIDIHNELWDFDYPAYKPGIDHQFVIDHIRGLHHDYNRPQ